MVIFHIYVELPEGKAQQPWPQRFYVITYESGTGLQHFLLALIIGGVLLACMFPVWPMWAKAAGALVWGGWPFIRLTVRSCHKLGLGRLIPSS